jgi:hypothetical protein
METNEPKKPRERSREYPQYDLKFCIDLTETINAKLGNRFSSAEQLSKVFGKSITYLGSQLSSCKQYSLLELKKGDGYKPTEAFYKVTRGRTGQDRLEASIYCLKSPSIYSDFIEKYDLQEMPTDLPSIFYWDYSITEGAKDAAAKIFLENLNYLGLISSDGKLIVEAQKQETEIPTPPRSTLPHLEPIRLNTTNNQPTHSVNLTHGYKRADIKITNGRFISLEFPPDLSNDDIDKIRKILDTWKDD